MALVASSIPHSVRQASFSESSNDLRGGSTYATQNDEFADSRRASRQQVVNRGTTHGIWGEVIEHGFQENVFNGHGHNPFFDTPRGFHG